MQIIFTEKAPKPIGPYSQAIKYENLIFISGQIAIDPQTNQFVDGDIKTQTKIILENIKAILEEAGLSLNHIIKTTIFLTDLTLFSDFNEIYEEYFNQHKPARSTVEVRRLPKNALIEIEVLAGL